MTALFEINEGDPVIVEDTDGRTWPGTVVGCNSRLVHIAYPGSKYPQGFRRSTQQATNRAIPRSFRRLVESDTEQRRRKALTTLREHGLALISTVASPPLHTLEAAARAVSGAEPAPAEEPISYDPNLED